MQMRLKKKNIPAMIQQFKDIKEACFTEPGCTIPGLPIHMYKKGNHREWDQFPGREVSNNYKVAIMQESFYNEIVFSKKMASDHMPPAYDEAILSLV